MKVLSWGIKFLDEVLSWIKLCPRDIKGIRSFLGHVGFYRIFINDFSNISRPLTNLLQKDVPFLVMMIV